MKNKKYEVFVSSTYEDLQEERRRVRDALLEGGYFPVGMEQFPADNDGSWEIIKDLINESDYYVLIIRERYGSIKRGTGKSFTQLEYEYAVEHGVSVCAFLYEPLKREVKTDSNPEAQKKLEDFKKQVKKGHQINYWKDATDLVGEIINSLDYSKENDPRPGWVRGSVADAQPASELPKKEVQPLREPRHPSEPEMMWVEGGTFWMGSDEERPIHKVTLSGFYIGKYEVTQGQWKALMGNNPSYFPKGDDYPVENVSWKDTREFCKRLSEVTGKPYRLPTEAEWEYAARGGQQSKDYKYSGSDNLDDVGWYKKNSGDSTHPVGQKQPNELGLYDMSGNVWEWCSDWYGEYPASAQIDPKGPSRGTYRVLRGGSWIDASGDAASASRGARSPAYYSSIYGLRVVASPL